MQAAVSVILPYYNAESTLARAIKSILNQRFKDFELLLINNNSTDKSLSVARDFAHIDSRIRLLDEKAQGVAFAMNCGLKNARGQYLARMDADDFAWPEKLEKQVAYLRANPKTEVIGCHVRYIPHNENTAGFRRFVDWVNSFHSAKTIEIKRFAEIPVINPTLLFRRELFEKYGGCLDGDFPEDYEMQLRYLEAGVKMEKLPEQLLDWHDYSTRLTRTDERYSIPAFFRTKAIYFKKWSEKNNPFHPNIWVWGAGRKTRQRAQLLKNEGIIIKGYIDIIAAKTTKTKTIHYSKIPDPGKIFILQMVNKNAAREQIVAYLTGRKYTEGVDFILMV